MPEFIPDPLDGRDLATEVADLLHQVNHAIRRQAAADTAPSGVGAAQMRALRTLVRGDTPLRMSELAEALGIVRRSATSVVDGLEQLRLVERIPDPDDRRAVRVQLTAAGRKAMVDARRRRRSAATLVLGRLDRSDLEALHLLLGRLAAG